MKKAATEGQESTNLPLLSRRTFVKATAAAASLLLEIPLRGATPLGLPIGLQVYTVGAEMDRDPLGTLKAIVAIGYKQVEISPKGKVTAPDLKRMLDDCGLKNPSGHYMLFDLLPDLQKNIDLAHQFGEHYMVVTMPWVADPSRLKSDGGKDQIAAFLALMNNLTLDDWKWNAEQFNRIGEQVKRAGLELCYHNHNFEFRPLDGLTGYDEFLRLTDPELVKLQLDCGWMAVAGIDPVSYLTKYPDRYRMLHIKDFKKGAAPDTTLGDQKPGAPIPTELGRGAVDYRRIFATARKGQIAAYYVEQEPWLQDMPMMQAIQVDYDYLRNLEG